MLKKIVIYSTLLAFVSLAFLTCNISNKIYYGPTKEIAHYPDTLIYKVEEINFKSSTGKKLNGWFLKPKSDSIIATVLQLHGNGGNISYQYQFAEPLIKKGFQIMVFDYEGYGKSEGEPTQEAVLDDALQALYYAKNRADVKNKKLILFGQSLGGHLSIVVAAKEQKLIDALIVEAPFSGHLPIAIYHAKKSYHLPAFVPKMLISSKYEALDYIAQISVPKLIIHSTEDNVCPFFMGKELFEKALAPKDFWEIKGGHIQASHLYSNEFAEKFLKIIE